MGKGLERTALENCDYEVIPPIIKTKKTTTNSHSEYKALDQSKMSTKNQEYASLSLATSTSKVSLASSTSGHDVKTSGNTKSKRQGIVIASLSVDCHIPSSSQGDGTASSERLPVCKPKPKQTINRVTLEANCHQQTPALSRKRNHDGTGGSFKPAIRPKPDCNRLKTKPQHRYENVTLNK